MIADEAHRSQYDLIDGLARNQRDSLPNASFTGIGPRWSLSSLTEDSEIRMGEPADIWQHDRQVRAADAKPGRQGGGETTASTEKKERASCRLAFMAKARMIPTAMFETKDCFGRQVRLTDEKLDFIINYDIKYRMGLSGGSAEEE